MATSEAKVPVRETGRAARAMLRYGLTVTPPIPVTLFVALQHILVSLSGALSTSYVVADVLCAHPGHPIRARLFSTTLFMSGLCTVVQTTLGLRLPVFQGASSTFLVPLFALGKNPAWACPDPQAQFSGHTIAGTQNATFAENVTSAATGNYDLSLEDKLQQLSGSLMLSSMLEVLLGGLGLIRPLLRYIGPLTIAPTIALIGLSLFELPVIYAKSNPAIAVTSAVLVVVFSLYLNRVQLPLPSCKKGQGRMHFPLFQLFPILLAIVFMWVVCWILTATDVFPNDKSHYSYYSRTDSKLSVVTGTPWIQISYPGQFGAPSLSLAATVGFSAAVIANAVESMGDYFTTAKICQVPPPPHHAMSRGILVEGLGSLLSGAMGAAHATTSYSTSIAILSLTKTFSRSILVVSGVILIILSLLGKVGAVFAIIPTPILGGVFLVAMGMLAAIGLSILGSVKMTSNRNLLITGVAFMSGLSVSAFVQQHGDMLVTGSDSADQVIRVILGTPMFLGGILAFILDNTVPGTDEERGIKAWRKWHVTSQDDFNGSDDTPMEGINNDVEDIDMKVHQNSTLLHGPVKNGNPRAAKENNHFATEDVYSFKLLKGRFSNKIWRFIPFLPPNVVITDEQNDGDDMDQETDTERVSNTLV